jgi:hypothetical protein
MTKKLKRKGKIETFRRKESEDIHIERERKKDIDEKCCA